MPEVITDNLDLWSSALLTKSTAGRGSNGKLEAYGIKKLRALILELAVRGKLVPQDPNDEPASVLLDRIAKEKTRLIKEGAIRKETAPSEITEEETPHKIPASWEWARLTDLYYSISPSGKKLKTSQIVDEGQYPVVDQGQSYVAGYTNDPDLLIEIPGPVVIFGDHTTEIKYVDFNFVAGADGTKILRPYLMDEKYFYTYLKSYKLENRGYARHFKVLNANLMALPPRAEQHRIVAKVDELMALCDQLEQQQTHSIEAHQTLVETLLGTLTRVESQQEFSAAWARIASHFDTLFTTESSINQLQQTVLQLAVMGKLITQDPNDEAASEFLKKIAREKARLIKDGAIRKQKELPEIKDEEIGFNLSAGWAVSRLGTFTNVGTGATPSRDKSAYWSPQEVNWVASGETSNDFIAETSEKISSLAVRETNVTVYPVGTLIVAMYGQGKTRGQVSELMIEAGTNQACAAVVLINKDEAHRKYLKLFFKKAYEEMRSHSAGGAQPNLNVGKISNTVVPIPPLAEQHRIVAKVDELMALCGALTVQIKDAQTTQLHLADAIVEQAVC